MGPSKFFTIDEFLQSRTAARNGIDMRPPTAVGAALEALVVKILDPLRADIGLPIKITSGYRPPALNRLIGGSDTSQHTLGQAADIQVVGMTPLAVCRRIVALKLPFDQLIFEFGQWTHVSYGPRNRRQVLTAKHVGGKTVYLPGLVP